MDYARFVFVCVFFGSNFLLMERAGRWFGPAQIAFGRLAGATLLLSLAWWLYERRGRVCRGDWLDAALVGLLVYVYPYLAQPALIGLGFGHSYFGSTVAFTPLFTVLASIPLLGKRPSTRELVGVLAGLGFVAILSADGAGRGISWVLLALAYTVPLCYAVGNVWLRRRLNHAPPTALTTVLTAVSMVAVAPLLGAPAVSGALGLGRPAAPHDFWLAAAAVVALGVVGTGVCMLFFVQMIQSRGPLFAGMATYVVPLVALVWGLVDGERVTTLQVVAIVGTLLMVALVQAPSKRVGDEVAPRCAAEDSAKPEAPCPAPGVAGRQSPLPPTFQGV